MKKSIYISRRVLNIDEIREWAKEQGFETCLPGEDMHVTVAFDKKKHDWRDLPLDREETVSVVDPDERSVAEFRGGAIVLEIYSQELTARWAELVQSGLYWKWPDYRPHITFTYNLPEGVDLESIEPFPGVILLGPEIIDEVVDTWKHQREEEEL